MILKKNLKGEKGGPERGRWGGIPFGEGGPLKGGGGLVGFSLFFKFFPPKPPPKRNLGFGEGGLIFLFFGFPTQGAGGGIFFPTGSPVWFKGGGGLFFFLLKHFIKRWIGETPKNGGGQGGGGGPGRGPKKKIVFFSPQKGPLFRGGWFRGGGGETGKKRPAHLFWVAAPVGRPPF